MSDDASDYLLVEEALCLECGCFVLISDVGVERRLSRCQRQFPALALVSAPRDLEFRIGMLRELLRDGPSTDAHGGPPFADRVAYEIVRLERESEQIRILKQELEHQKRSRAAKKRR